jgi:hypothetical protein
MSINWHRGQKVVCLHTFDKVFNETYVIKNPPVEGKTYTIVYIAKNPFNNYTGLILAECQKFENYQGLCPMFDSTEFIPLELWNKGSVIIDGIMEEINA